MSIQSIEWHEECLKNNAQFLAAERRKILSDIISYLKAEHDYYIRVHKLQNAKDARKLGYDFERYCKDLDKPFVPPKNLRDAVQTFADNLEFRDTYGDENDHA